MLLNCSQLISSMLRQLAVMLTGTTTMLADVKMTFTDTSTLCNHMTMWTHMES